MAFDQWSAAQRITSGRLAAMTPKFSPWTPTWTTSTGVKLPSYGNAVITCRWAQSGDLVTANLYIKFGSSTVFGGGAAADNYRFGLPVAAANTGLPCGRFTFAAGTSAPVELEARVSSDNTFFELWVASGGATNAGVADAVTPAAWTSGLELSGMLQYEAA